MVDVVLRKAWTLHVGPREKDVDLVAVGGYGRGELHPCSDIDVLILLPKSEVADGHEGIERFLAFLWDIGLEVGHSVRTIDDCQRESAADVSVATTLIEARLLCGPRLPVPGDAARARPGQRLVVEGLLRGEGGRAAGAPPPPPRHRLQPRAEREDEPGRPARHPDDRLGGQAPLRRRDAGRAGGPRVPDRERAQEAPHGAGVPVEGALRAARDHRPARGPAAVRPPEPHREDSSATRTRATRSRSSSSCSATTAP